MSYSYLQQTVDASNATTYTFSAQNLGRPDTNRYIVVAIASRKAGTTTSISSVTVGGVTATITVQLSTTVTNTCVTGIVIAAVPTGATGDIVVTFGTTMGRCGIAVYRLDKLLSVTDFAHASNGADDPTVSLNCPNQGCVIGIATTSAAAGCSWTGLTEDYDVTMEATNQYSGASKFFINSVSGLTILADFASGTESSGCFASWQFNPPSEFLGFI